jgi:hypothetical protein
MRIAEMRIWGQPQSGAAVAASILRQKAGNMRWLHEGIDRLHVALVSRLFPPVFRRGQTSPSLQEHLAAVRLTLPPLSTTRHYTLTAQTLVGVVEAGLHVRLGPQPGLPVLVYHHGIAEFPYDKTFRGIFRAKTPVAAHLVAIRAPYHRSYADCARGLATLEQFMAMCAVSIALSEAVRQALMAQGALGSVVTGTSLGGFLALMHHLVLGTADCYIPLLAGPDLAHVLLATHYRRFVAPQALAQALHLQARLDFRQALQARPSQRVFPLLARYDRCMVYAHHQACYAASGIQVSTLERGHITGALAFAALRAHVRTCLHTLLSTAP